VLAVTVWAWRWVKDRERIALARVLASPWYLWPLARIVVSIYKRELDKDIYDYTWHGRDDDNNPKVRPWWYIRIGTRNGRPEVKVRLGRGFPQGDEEVDINGKRVNPKKKLVQQATGVLGLGKLDYKFDFWLWRRNVKLRPRLVVPQSAIYHEDQDVREAFHKLRTKDAVPIAIGKGDRPIVHSWDDDAPHGLLSAITMGGGKTTTLRTIGVAAWLEGHEVLILDPIKQHSHTGWAIDPRTGEPYPRVFYADEIEEAAGEIIRARALMDKRNLIVKTRKRSGRKAPVFPRLVVLLDDGNGLTQEFKRHANPRHQRPNIYNEALDCFAMLLWCGREVYINIMAAFQRASAIATTGGDVREMFGLRMIAGTSEKTADLVADQVDKAKMPKPLSHSVQPGHCVMVYGTEAFEAQRILIREDDCRAMIERHLRPALPSGQQPTQWDSQGYAGQEAPRGLPPERHADTDDGYQPERERHRSPASTGQALTLDVPELEHATDDGNRGQPHQASHEGDDGDDHQYQGEEEGGGFHDPTLPYSGTRVNQNYRTGRVDNDTTENQPTILEGHSLSQKHRRSRLEGFSGRLEFLPSMQGLSSGLDSYGNDGGIEYSTLGEIAERPWCQYTADTLGRYSRAPLKERLRFPDPVIPRQGRAPARWSEREMEEWCEARKSRESQKGYQPLVYFIISGGRAELRWGAIVKIGKTINLDRRLDELAAHPEDVVDTIPCDSEDEMDALETKLHKDYEVEFVDGESLRVYPNRELFRVKGSLAEALGVVVSA
jgi:hypothetical protein